MTPDLSCCGCSGGQRCTCICHRDRQHSPGTPGLAVQIQWHSPDQVHAAALVRDGQPWLLGGALVGMGATPGAAVDELVGAARYLVIHGQNYLTGGGVLSPADREWLYSLLGGAGLERDDEMYAAIRAARGWQGGATAAPT